MSQKAAVVFILDVGYSELLPAEEGKNFVETSRECTSITIQSKIFTKAKDEVSLILMGCNDCSEHDGEGDNNIKVAYPLELPTWHLVRKLKSVCSSYRRANWIEAVNMALRLLRMSTGRFSEKKIIIFSSNLKLGSLSKLSDLECGIQDMVVDLNLVHPNGIEGPNMEELNGEIEEAKAIVEKVEGTNHNINDVAHQLLLFQKKKVKPRPWNVSLDIGSQILIPVSGYKKINEGQSLKWESCLSSEGKSIVFPEKFSSSTHEESLAESNIKVSRMNVKVREDGTEVDSYDIIEGYRFGSTIVPFREEDKEQLKYVGGDKCLSVVKITKKVFVPRHFWIEKSSHCFVAREDDEDAALAFSAIVQALHHMECVAIVRKVYQKGAKPHMGALFPVIKPKKEYLVYVDLPFSSYMRQCHLPELNTNNLKKAQFDVIDQLIDGMDLSAPVDDDKESMMYRDWSDLLQPHLIFDPYLQHVRKCVASRILNPSDPLPSIDPDIYKMLTEPPQPIKESVSGILDQISILFPNLEPECDVRKKGRWKRFIASTGVDDVKPEANDTERPIKQIKLESEISEMKKEIEEPEIVGILSPVKDFEAAVELNDIPFIKVCSHMQNIIVKLVLNSFGLADFEKPKDSLRALRNAVITHKMEKRDAVSFFNNWMKDVYQLLQEKFKMGFWNLVMQDNLGFITSEEFSESSLTVEEVKEILGSDGLVDQTLSDEEEMDLPLDL